MRPLHSLLLVALLILCSACASDTESTEGEAATTYAQRAELIDTITQQRKDIEARNSELTRYEVSTDSLREQIKQKWSRIHFYADGDTLLRVKTYPHDEVSTRTEEFYFQDGQLITAVIQDAGTTADEDKEGQKAYFYSGGEVVGERNTSGEKERTIRESDAEQLQSEAREYLEIYRTHFVGD